MSREARDWAWSRQGLTLAQRLVLLALAEHANEQGERCFPSLALLERMTELSRRGITKALNGLDGSLLERDRGGPGRATSYRLLLSASRDDEPCPDDREHHSLFAGEAQGSLGNPVPNAGEPSALSGSREQSALGNPVPKDREPSSSGREQRSSLIGNPVPPNRHNNRHRTDSEPSLPYGDDTHQPEPPSRGKTKGTLIPPDWQPSGRVYDWAVKQGTTPEWVSAQIDEFVVYWSDTGKRRESWDATFINRLRTLQASAATRQDHEPESRLADKDYSVGATPLDQIPWLRPNALG